MSDATYRVWEWDMKEDTETVIATGLSLKEAMVLVKIHPEGFPRRPEKEEVIQ